VIDGKRANFKAERSLKELVNYVENAWDYMQIMCRCWLFLKATFSSQVDNIRKFMSN
jgi:hypothetical protein